MPERRRRGIALITALFVLVFLFILGLVFRFYCDQHLIFASDVARRNQLYYLAEAGIEYAIYERAMWPAGVSATGTATLDFPSGSVEIQASDSSTGFQIVSRAKLYKVSGISASIRNSEFFINAQFDNAGNITAWTESQF
ncbi:MAG: hypothetical protein AB2L14_24865 [Candidatus Xenobiia bacterium LiM19]